MLPQRVLVRSTQRLARAPVARTAFRKRPYSSGPSGLTGAADNEFNRERLAVKQHATETSGEFNAGSWPTILFRDVKVLVPSEDMDIKGNEYC